MVYFRPRELQEALAWLAENKARIAAGCTDLFAATGASSLQEPILDITAIKGLRTIATDDRYWRFGATTTWTDVIRADLPPAFDGLKLAAREVGSVQIQNAGTLAGNLCNASPAADGMPVWLSLDASVELASNHSTRVLALADFVTGIRRTALKPGELVTAILVPKASAAGRSTFLKLGARKYLVISIAMVAARLVVEDGIVAQAAVSVGACGPVATRLATVEAALVGHKAGHDLAALVTDGDVAGHLSPISDPRADAAYRTSAATELVRRAIFQLSADQGEMAA